MNAQDAINYMASLSLAMALWWFIENVSDDTMTQADRNEVFFALRERVRSEQQ